MHTQVATQTFDQLRLAVGEQAGTIQRLTNQLADQSQLVPRFSSFLSPFLRFVSSRYMLPSFLHCIVTSVLNYANSLFSLFRSHVFAGFCLTLRPCAYTSTNQIKPLQDTSNRLGFHDDMDSTHVCAFAFVAFVQSMIQSFIPWIIAESHKRASLSQLVQSEDEKHALRARMQEAHTAMRCIECEKQRLLSFLKTIDGYALNRFSSFLPSYVAWFEW